MPEPLIDCYATERQYTDHIAPIWEALEPHERGVAWLAGTAQQHRERFALLGETRIGTPRDRRHPRPVAVASYQDERAVRPRPIVHIEHGAGLHYPGDPRGAHPSYSGSARHERVVLFICPSEEVAGRWRSRYPDVPAVPVGCPRLDPWLVDGGPRLTAPLDTSDIDIVGASIVAVSFHGDVRLLPETRWAFPHYQHALPDLAGKYRLLGHAHPRVWGKLQPFYATHGIEATPNLEDVFDRASVYIVDNSSSGFEMAALGRPVIWANSPLYRRDVEHGARFWQVEHEGGGLMVDEPDELPDAIDRALAGEGVLDADFLDTIYTYRDGHSAERAADAIREVCG